MKKHAHASMGGLLARALVIYGAATILYSFAHALLHPARVKHFISRDAHSSFFFAIDACSLFPSSFLLRRAFGAEQDRVLG